MSIERPRNAGEPPTLPKGSSSNLVANFVAEVVKTFEKLGESKLLTSSATKLNAGQPLKYAKSPRREGDFLVVDEVTSPRD